VAPVTLPFRLTCALFAHTETAAPALTTGAGVKFNCTLSATAMQPPLPVVVNVRVTEPLETSPGVGVYCAPMFVVLGSKDPAPPLHTPPVATVNEPCNVATALFAQSVWSTPAFAVGAGVIVYVTLSLTALQLPLPTVVSVSVTVPAVRSAALGVYTAFSVALFGL